MVPGDSDVRAIENPISAIFDLSESVARETETIQKMIRYSKIFIAFWLIVNFLLALGQLFANLILGIILFAFFIIGLISLRQLYRTDRFFRYYTLRHRAIKAVRDADPIVYVPKGNSAASRFMTHLTANDKRLSEALASGKAIPAEHGMLKGRTGVFYTFDSYIHTKQSSSFRFLGTGEPGGAMFIKTLEKPPTMDDMRSVEAAVQDVTKETRLPPRRIILLWKRDRDENLNDDVYEHITSKTVNVKVGRKCYICAIQIVIENSDDTYEFIPYMAEVA